MESSCHVSDHPILICFIQGYLVGIFGLMSAKTSVFRVYLHNTTTLFWIVSSMFFWGPRHELLNAVSNVKIQLKVIKILVIQGLILRIFVCGRKFRCFQENVQEIPDRVRIDKLRHDAAFSYESLRSIPNLHTQYGLERSFQAAIIKLQPFMHIR